MLEKPLNSPREVQLSSARIRRTERNGLPKGTRAPDFLLPRLDGGHLSISDFCGRGVLLVFSDPMCQPCDLLSPHLERLARRTPDIQVIMVSRRGREANLAKVQQHGLSFPIVLQRQWEISRAFNKFATPIAYLIDEDGLIASELALGPSAILQLLTTSAILCLLTGKVRAMHEIPLQ
jgi:peroxiredoxin